MSAPDAAKRLEQFVQISALLTGYEQTKLWGTGMAAPYLDKIDRSEVPAADVTRLLEHGIDVAVPLDNQTLGPLAKNVIKLWYLGVWADEFFPMSGPAFVQGLAWEALGGHPQGAKQAGFASWARPPIGQEDAR